MDSAGLRLGGSLIEFGFAAAGQRRWRIAGFALERQRGGARPIPLPAPVMRATFMNEGEYSALLEWLVP